MQYSTVEAAVDAMTRQGFDVHRDIATGYGRVYVLIDNEWIGVSSEQLHRSASEGQGVDQGEEGAGAHLVRGDSEGRRAERAHDDAGDRGVEGEGEEALLKRLFWKAFGAGFTCALLGMVWGSMIAALIKGEDEKTYLIQPNCPTEDSCTVNYEDGIWYVEEDK